jgi:carbamoyl-phosphate synthase small subunit
MADNISYLYLEDGTVFEGEGFGSCAVRAGELAFTTSMNGYPESLTDPSYAGQALIITHPLVGNYGVPHKKYDSGILSTFESENIHVTSLMVSELTSSSKWNSRLDLDDWLKEEGVPGISGVDTRLLTKKVREMGAMMCVVSTDGKVSDVGKAIGEKYTEINFVDKVSPKEPIVQERNNRNVVVVDCGVKHGILKSIAALGYNVVRVPYNYTADQIMQFSPLGIVYSNGPGNPNMLGPVVDSMRGILEYKLPVFGICLGHQIAAIALGGSVRKMKFGHRAINKAAVDMISRKAYITSHNHGYAVFGDGVPEEWKAWFMSPDDGVVEGIMYKDRNMITTQFHPEGLPGTNDAAFIFGMFDRMIKEGREGAWNGK